MSEADLERFVAVAEAGSLSEAARDLGIPRETLSRQIARLEERLGVLLLHRSTRRLVPTEAGAELLRRARPIVEATRDAEDAVRAADGVPRGLLRVSAPPMGTYLGQIATAYVERYPQVRLEIEVSTRHVDLVGEGYDLAIRAGTVTDPSLIVRLLMRNRLIAVASPSLLARFGAPTTLDDVASMPCILGFTNGLRVAETWPLLDGGSLRVRGPLASNDLEVRIGAAKAGLGVALLPGNLVQAACDAGELVTVLPDRVGTSTTVSVVYPNKDYVPPKTRAFTDLCVELLGPAFEARVRAAGRVW